MAAATTASTSHASTPSSVTKGKTPGFPFLVGICVAAVVVLGVMFVKGVQLGVLL